MMMIMSQLKRKPLKTKLTMLMMAKEQLLQKLVSTLKMRLMIRIKLSDLTKELSNSMILISTTGSKDLMPLWFNSTLHGAVIAKNGRKIMTRLVKYSLIALQDTLLLKLMVLNIRKSIRDMILKVIHPMFFSKEESQLSMMERDKSNQLLIILRKLLQTQFKNCNVVS